METIELKNFDEKLKERFELGEVVEVEIYSSIRTKVVYVKENDDSINITVPFARGNRDSLGAISIARMVKKYRDDHTAKVDNALRQLADMDCVKFITKKEVK